MVTLVLKMAQKYKVLQTDLYYLTHVNYIIQPVQHDSYRMTLNINYV